MKIYDLVLQQGQVILEKKFNPKKNVWVFYCGQCHAKVSRDIQENYYVGYWRSENQVDGRMYEKRFCSEECAELGIKRERFQSWRLPRQQDGTKQEFHHILCELRLRHNMTPAELALKLALPEDAYDQIEAGAMVPAGDTFERMTELFGVSFDYLLTGEHVNATFQKVKNQLVSVFMAADLSQEEITQVLERMSEEAEKRSDKVFYNRIYGDNTILS
ncbi:helix-turn-helix transcriptional regulator (plasmid) [Brevibacillus composti]|uniref:Helix-turn-helix transcriptional regulator n=1 Tax=Brevibacillus composti TaxID=2796470 RepID=A0A7T5EQ86_9BACL|nr:helix-turn-helix transcriptional regulator [Brevibacillus composti]QQE76760.1 helix-turn-helix transcriptional regulator [Brevibacillus composti]QUO43821.1 helix-turn-helix transcriptional regulator [Brevibacillus composti]